MEDNSNRAIETKVEEMAVNAWLGHRTSFVDWRQKCQYLVDRYENKLRPGSITAQLKINALLGASFALVENALPRIIGKKPKWRYLGREESDGEEAEIYDEFSEYQFDEANAKEELEEIVKWGLITGLSGGEMGWEKKQRVVQKSGKEIMGLIITNPMALKALKSLGLDKKLKDGKKDETKNTSNWTITAIPTYDLIWSPTARNVASAPVKGYKMRKRLIELKRDGYKTDALEAQLLSNDEDVNRANSSEGISPTQKVLTVQEQEVDVAKLYVDYQDESGLVRSYIVMLGSINGGTPVSIGTMENPLNEKITPMVFFTPIKRPGKAYGFGMIEPSLGVIDAEEDALNLNLKGEFIATVPPIEYNPANIIDLEALKYEEMALTPVRMLGQSMAIMPTPRPNTGSYQFLTDFLQKAKQNISGITDYQTGADQKSGGKTLGEIQLKTEESNSRMGQVQTNFENQVIWNLGYFALIMNKQYLKEEKEMMFRIVGKKGQVASKTIDFDDIDSIKDIAVVPGSTALASQNEEFQKWSNLLLIANNEMATPNPVQIDKDPIIERLIENGLRITDSQVFLPSKREREEAEVGGKQAQIADAKSENEQPQNARVLPEDDDQVHIAIHNAEIERRNRELEMAQQSGMEVPPEVADELQMLTQHRDDHVTKAGGVNPGSTPGELPPNQPMP
jgi:hypothetical protein